jgi:hypothetical protein
MENKKMKNEITPRRNRFDISKDNVHTSRDVSGVNPPKFNLKDHPEVDGRRVMILGGTQTEGEFGIFLIAPALIYPVDVDIFGIDEESRAAYAVTLITGSENVMERAMDAISSGQVPLVGTLRNEGRAWFLD